MSCGWILDARAESFQNERLPSLPSKISSRTESSYFHLPNITDLSISLPPDRADCLHASFGYTGGLPATISVLTLASDCLCSTAARLANLIDSLHSGLSSSGDQVISMDHKFLRPFIMEPCGITTCGPQGSTQAWWFAIFTFQTHSTELSRTGPVETSPGKGRQRRPLLLWTRYF
jgi:hypothetical protein